MGEKLVSGNAGWDGDQSAASPGTPALDWSINFPVG